MYIYILACLVLIVSSCAIPASLGPIQTQEINMPPHGETPTSVISIPTHTLSTPSITPLASDAGLYAWFPLEIANSWIYSYTGYVEENQATWRISDTVVDIQQLSGYKIARIQRQVTWISQPTSVSIPDQPVPGEYWYLTDGSHLYKQSENLNLEAVTDSWLELIYPVTEGECWYPDPAQRFDLAMMTPPPMDRLPGCRYVAGEAGEVETELGVLKDCYLLETVYNSGPTFITFCPGIGIVGRKYDHIGSNFGYESVIIGYSLESP